LEDEMHDYQTLRSEALNLSLTEKANLLVELFENLMSTSQKEREYLWAMEAEKRLQAYDEGKLEAEDWKSLKNRVLS
jgi:hypothetical protein